MALKSKLTKAEFDALAEPLKEHYKLVGADYLLDSDDATELREAKRREKERADALQAELDAAKTAKLEADRIAAEAAAEAARKTGDVAAIEASWQNKLEAQRAEDAAKLAIANKSLESLLVDNQAIALTNEIAKTPALAKLLLPHVKARLRAETEGDTPITRVLDAAGKPSALTIADLSKEFVANPDFADIIKGSNATGGGAGSHSGNGGGAGSKKLSELSEAERVTLSRENPTEWARIRAAGG
jgi:hypothetical protein